MAGEFDPKRLIDSLELVGVGAAYGTAKAGVGVAGSGVINPDLVVKNLIPVVMASVLAIYGLIIAVIVGTTGSLCFFFFSTRIRMIC